MKILKKHDASNLAHGVVSIISATLETIRHQFCNQIRLKGHNCSDAIRWQHENIHNVMS